MPFSLWRLENSGRTCESDWGHGLTLKWNAAETLQAPDGESQARIPGWKFKRKPGRSLPGNVSPRLEREALSPRALRPPETKRGRSETPPLEVCGKCRVIPRPANGQAHPCGPTGVLPEQAPRPDRQGCLNLSVPARHLPGHGRKRCDSSPAFRHGMQCHARRRVPADNPCHW